MLISAMATSHSPNLTYQYLFTSTGSYFSSNTKGYIVHSICKGYIIGNTYLLLLYSIPNLTYKEITFVEMDVVVVVVVVVVDYNCGCDCDCG